MTAISSALQLATDLAMSQPPPSTTSRMARPIAAKPAPSREHVASTSFPMAASSIIADLGAVANGNGRDGTISTTSNLSVDSESTGPRPFETKFSAATEMILKRIREGGTLNPSAALRLGTEGCIQPPGYESVRRSVLQGMKTTLSIDLDAVIPPSSIRRGAGVAPPKAITGSSTPTSSGSSGAAGAAASTPTPDPAPGTKAKFTPKAGKAGKAGAKRKRAKEESESTEDSGAMSDLGGDSDSEGAKSVTNLPTKTLSGRKVVKPAQFDPAAIEGPVKKRTPYRRVGRSAGQVLCKRCGRGHSPANNMIVFCDGCNLAWHQMCHDPMVSDEIVKDQNQGWYCSDCSLKRGHVPGSVTEVSKNSSWAERGIEERRVYLSSFPQSHLVSLLLQAVTMHPDIPIYAPVTMSSPSTQQPQPQPQPQPQNPVRYTDRRLNVYPQQPFPPSATSTAGLFTRAEANPSAPINFIRKIQPDPTSPSSPFATSFNHTASAGAPKPSISVSTIAAENSTSTHPPFQLSSLMPPMFSVTLPHDNEDESRESTPASPPYPKPGNGLMAKLPPDDQDLDWLVGEGEDEAAFSHVVIDAQGRTQKVDEKSVTASASRKS